MQYGNNLFKHIQSKDRKGCFLQTPNTINVKIEEFQCKLRLYHFAESCCGSLQISTEITFYALLIIFSGSSTHSHYLLKLKGGVRNGCNVKLKDKTTLIRNINYVFLHYTKAIGVFKVNAKCSIDAAIKYSIEMKILYMSILIVY